MRFTTVICSGLAAAVASAQQHYVIDPSTVTNATRQYWCDQQQTQCPLICLQTTPSAPQSNDCTASTLTYACVCSDGRSPNLTQYSQTLPFFICQEWTNQCALNCGSADPRCQSDCREKHPCGAQSPVRVNVTTASAGAGASATAGGSEVVHSGFAGQEGEENGAGVEVAGVSGPALLGAALALGFAVLL